MIVLGDMNSQIGQEHICRYVLGTYSMHTVSNENGILMIQMASMNNLEKMSKNK